MSSPGTPPTPRPEALKKLAQLRIERLKKEEEEEQWISGEELYTEGSSDEDDTAVRGKRKANEKGLKKPSRSAGSKPKKHTKDEKIKFQKHLSPPQFNLPSCSDVQVNFPADSGKDEKSTVFTELDPKPVAGDTLASRSTAHDDEEPAEISWRPKRGLSNENLASVDMDVAYSAVIGKVRKLKELLSPEPRIFFSNLKNQEGSHVGKKYFGNKKLNGEKNICNLLSNDWNFLQQRCDVESAFSNINILDHLLEIIDQKQKDARKETQNVQLQVRDELSQLCESQETTDEIIKNTSNFLQHCLYTESKVNLKDTKSLIMSNNLQDAESDTEHKNCTGICEQNGQTKTESVEIIHKNFNLECEAKKCRSNVVSDDNFIRGSTKDDMQTVSFSNDEEKRLAVILDDKSESRTKDFSQILDVSSNNTYTAGYRRAVIHDAYSLNQEAKVTLGIIDDRLKVFSRTQSENEVLKGISYLPDNDRDLLEDKNKICEGIDEKLQLHKIDSLLESLKQPNNNEIQPLTNEQITALVKLSVANNDNEKDADMQTRKVSPESAESSLDEQCKIPLQNTKSLMRNDTTSIKILVSEAKLSMPHFKFKHLH